VAKIRVDELLVRQGLVESRSKAAALILAGKVRDGTRRLDKPGHKIPEETVLELESPPRYVSRGGEKLQQALSHWSIPIENAVALDAGASTGGFTDCLLQHGARRVNCVDVGTGQLHWKLRQDERVWFREKLHILETHPQDLPDFPFDLVVTDLSFISLKRVLEHLWQFLKPNGYLIALVKPQFECSQEEANKGKGIIRDPAIHQRICDEIESHAAQHMPHADFLGWCESPIQGGDGNREFLACWHKTEDK
jgi:23S rRNA (cytidine1920-2'-O)/16S rRNA (cytidine1409-2'-O)-methyltransferase